jgi:hypothetical protein
MRTQKEFIFQSHPKATRFPYRGLRDPKKGPGEKALNQDLLQTQSSFSQSGGHLARLDGPVKGF